MPGEHSAVEQYPFDRSLVGREHELHGLDRLRAIEDRKLAAALYDIWIITEKNESDPEFHREEHRRHAQQTKNELERLDGIADAALDGKHGEEAQSLAKRMLIDRLGQCRKDWKTLHEFESQLRKVRIR